MNASIRSQFEFVQQTWCNNPSLSGLSTNKDPIVGDHARAGDAPTRMVIPGDRGPLRTGSVTALRHRPWRRLSLHAQPHGAAVSRRRLVRVTWGAVGSSGALLGRRAVPQPANGVLERLFERPRFPSKFGASSRRVVPRVTPDDVQDSPGHRGGFPLILLKTSTAATTVFRIARGGSNLGARTPAMAAACSSNWFVVTL